MTGCLRNILNIYCRMGKSVDVDNSVIGGFFDPEFAKVFAGLIS